MVSRIPLRPRDLITKLGQHKEVNYFPQVWKYENEPRVFFKVRVYRSPDLINGGVAIIGIPESLVGKPKRELQWIRYELGGQTVKIKSWKIFIPPQRQRKRLSSS